MCQPSVTDDQLQRRGELREPFGFARIRGRSLGVAEVRPPRSKPPSKLVTKGPQILLDNFAVPD
jgi:hypothetical protein